MKQYLSHFRKAGVYDISAEQSGLSRYHIYILSEVLNIDV